MRTLLTWTFATLATIVSAAALAQSRTTTGAALEDPEEIFPELAGLSESDPPTPPKGAEPIYYFGNQIILDDTVPEGFDASTVVKATAIRDDSTLATMRVAVPDESGRYTLALDASELADGAYIRLVFWNGQAGDLRKWLRAWRRPGGSGSCTISNTSTNQTVPRCACADCGPRFTAEIFNATNETQDHGVAVYDGVTTTSLPIFDFDSRVMGLSFNLYHQSLKTCDGEMGRSWSHSFNLAVVQTSLTTGFIQTPNLEALPFSGELRFSSMPVWSVPEGFFSDLILDPREKRWVLTHHTGVELELIAGVMGQPGPLIGIREPNGNFTRVNRDFSGFVESVVSDLGQETRFAYGEEGRLSSVTDHIGRTWTFGHDEQGNLVAVDSPATEFADVAPGQEVIDSTLEQLLVTKGRTTAFAYEDARFPHHITRITDERGAVPIEYTYHKDLPNLGRVATKKINGEDVAFIYDPPTSSVPAPLPVLDPGNAVTRVIDREGNVTDYETHGPAGGPIEGMGKFGLRRKVRWTVRGQGNEPLRSDEPLHWEQRWLHDCDCLAPRQVSQPFRSDDELTFDDLGMPVGYPTEHFEYNDRRQVTAYAYVGAIPTPVTRGEVIRWEKTYDTAERFSRLLSYTEPRGFDANPIYAGLNLTHTYTYDRAGNRVRHDAPVVTRGVEGEQAVTESWTYNEFGQVTSHTDPNGNVTTYTYFDGPSEGGDVNTQGEIGGYLASMNRGAAGSSDAVTDLTTTYRVNALGMVTRMTDPKGFVYEHQYNDLLEKTGEIDAEVTLRSGEKARYETRYVYDGAGNMVLSRQRNLDVSGTVQANDFIDRSQSFDAVNNLVSSRVEVDAADANDLVTRFAYDGNDQLAVVQQPEGNRTFHLYDERRLRFKSFYGVAPSGGIVLPAGTAKSLIEGYPTDRRAETLESTAFVGLNVMTYDARANEIRLRDGRKNFVDHFHDFFNRRVATSDQNGNGSASLFDDASNVLTTLGGAVSKATGEVTEVLERTYNRYDELGRRFQSVLDIDLASVESAAVDPDDGRSSSYLTVFDPGSRVLARIDANGNPTTYTYDAADRPLSVTDALGNVRSYVYDANSNLVRMDELEVPGPGVDGSSELYVTAYTHDELNRRTEIHVLGLDGDSIDHETLYAYDSRSNTALVEDAEGNFTLTTFDDLDRAVMNQRFDGDPLVSSPTELSHYETVYDRNSRRTAELARSDATDPATDQVTRYAHDDLDRLIRTVHPDADDPIDGSTDGPDGVYDRVEVGYDEMSNAIFTRDQRRVEFSNTYDPGNRLTRQDIALPPSVPGTTRQDYTYDPLDRLTGAANDYALVERGYDPLSRITAESQSIRLDGSGFSNGYERPVSLVFDYDRQSNRTSVSVFSSENAAILLDLSTQHTFDALNRMEEIDASYFDRSLGPVAEYSYFGPTRVVRKTLGNGASLFRTYDVKRRVSAHSWFHLGNFSQLLVGFEYAYDDVDNPLFEIFQHDSNLADNYRYNSRYELTGVSYRDPDPVDYRTDTASFSTTFSYDDSFNRTEASFGDPLASVPNTEDSYAINRANEYTQIDRSIGSEPAGLSPPLHDAAGNMTRFPVRPSSGGSSGQDVDAEATWDAFNRLFTAAVPDGAQSSIAFEEIYRYDPFQRRIAKFGTSDDGCAACPRLTGRRYVYDGSTVVEERVFVEESASRIPANIDDRLERVYANGRRIDEPILSAIDGDGDMDLDGGSSVRNAPEGKDFEYYFLNGRLGSAMALLDIDNVSRILEYFRYTSFGEPTVLEGAQAPAPSPRDGRNGATNLLTDYGGSQSTISAIASRSRFSNVYLFHARRFDEMTGLYYQRARYYSPEIGRFLQRDTVIDPGQHGHLYAFVANRPMTRTDPYGNCPGASCASKDGSESCCCLPGQKCVRSTFSCWCESATGFSPFDDFTIESGDPILPWASSLVSQRTVGTSAACLKCDLCRNPGSWGPGCADACDKCTLLAAVPHDRFPQRPAATPGMELHGISIPLPPPSLRSSTPEDAEDTCSDPGESVIDQLVALLPGGPEKKKCTTSEAPAVDDNGTPGTLKCWDCVYTGINVQKTNCVFFPTDGSTPVVQ
jgi:RHS repeat-associated protein